MKAIESTLSLSSPSLSPARTTVAPRDSLATESRDEEWQVVLDRMIDLGVDANGDEERQDEDGYILPTASAVGTASKVAILLLNRGQAAPTAFFQDAVGGIIFEWTSGLRVDRLIFNRRGEMEVMEFYRSELVFRKQASIMRDFR